MTTPGNLDTIPDRVEAMMARYLGATVLEAFANDDVTEVYTNAHDGRIRLDTRSQGRVSTDTVLSPEHVLMFLDCVAMHVGVTLDADSPTLQAELPSGRFQKARLQGFIPSTTVEPAFAIRKPPRVVYTLHEYVQRDLMSPWHLVVVREAIQARQNVLIAGGTNSGKTTFANAMLHEIAEQCPTDRVVILEDTVELQCFSPDHLALRTHGAVTLRHLVKATLRASPNRVVVGEVRDEAALDLLDAWATGHPGGIATFHATDPRGALRRLDRLAQRANVPSQRALIAEAIDLIVMLAQTPQGRCVTQIVRVVGIDEKTDDFHLEPLRTRRAPSSVPYAIASAVSHETPCGAGSKNP